MSELKVIDVDKMADVRSLSGQFYRKSEVDKKIQSLEYICENYRCDCDNLGIITDKLKKAGRSLRKNMNHQKYKRCLAMAKLCNEKWLVHNFAEITTKLIFYDRWEKRWRELAEKFKEA